VFLRGRLNIPLVSLIGIFTSPCVLTTTRQSLLTPPLTTLVPVPFCCCLLLFCIGKTGFWNPRSVDSLYSQSLLISITNRTHIRVHTLDCRRPSFPEFPVDFRSLST
jgi:hypothetical protein